MLFIIGYLEIVINSFATYRNLSVA